MRRLLLLVALLFSVSAGVARASFDAGQCTAWAFLMRPDVVVEAMLANPALTNWDAARWAANARSAGLSVGTRPAVGAIAVWPAGVDGSGPVGHVAYVQKVKAGGAFFVTEEDWEDNPSPTSRWVSGASTSVRFIYVQPRRRVPAGPIADGGSLASLTSSGSYAARAAGATSVTLALTGPAVVAFRVNGPGIHQTVTRTFGPGSSEVVSLAALTGKRALPAGAYRVTAMPYSTALTWRWVTLRLG